MRCWLILLMLPFWAVPASAQTADELVSKYITAIGGMEHIQAIKSIRRTTKYVGGGAEIVVVEENKRPNRIRIDTTMMGLTGVDAFDGQQGWKIEPWGGKKDVEPLNEEEMRSFVLAADLDGPLVNYQAKGHKIENLGSEAFEGTDTFKLKVTLKNGDALTYFLDKDTYVPIKIETTRFIRGAERQYETILGNYKQVAGVYFPYSIESGSKGSPRRQQQVIEKIEVNKPIADERFLKPGTKPKADQASTDPTTPEPKSTEAPKPSPTQRSTTPAIMDSETISGLGARNIGSAAMSGRVAALDAAYEGQRLTICVGAASGGVWKSVNGGTTYKPVFDKQPVQSIGALTIDPKNPKTVWVGTGEAWTRNSTSGGDGIYKSTDGGENWTNMGLKDSERIGKIVVEPTDSKTVYVCALGKLWSDSEERGLYKTTDGGKTWAKILKGPNLSTGCSTMAIDPQNPKTIFAGLWDFRRKGWTFRSGGEGPDAPSGSGLFKSTDGGAKWTELDESSAKGLPPKPWGRSALAIAPSNPKVVYAFIEAAPPKNGLYRSDDGGKTWRLLDRSQSMIWRPFYFANLIVDPHEENKVYKTGGSLIVSNDGGQTFSNIAGGAHGDFHDVWIDSKNTDHLITGDDGGIWYSYDAGHRWWKGENLPISQFYHVSVDMDQPYHVYGGLQDNSAWIGASQYPGGITNHQWENMYGGDGFCMFADPADPDYIYVESQGGEIGRVNRKTHESRPIKPLPQYGEAKLRFNWNTPIALSPTYRGTVYIGAQILFRSRDRGQTWERISPDLTTNDPAKQKQEESGGITVDNSVAEMHTTIYAIAESPKDPNVIWVGTDDGNVQLTRDSGKSWFNVAANIQGLPKDAWVSSVEAGHFDAGTVYVTFDLHRSGDMRSHVYKTSDYGKTWKSLVTQSSSVRGHAYVVREDLVNRDLLFLGTEFGLWVSLDAGGQWVQYKGGEMPSVPVMDLAIHPRDHDLVIATHGRGIWIIDDITPLRGMTPDILGRNIAFIKAKPTAQSLSASGGWVNGDAQFVGVNRTEEATITYYQGSRHIFGDFKIEVFDDAGKLLGTVPASKRRGLNRATWSMRLPPPKVPPAATGAGSASVGPRVLPGNYTVKLTKDNDESTTQLSLAPDPRSTHTAEDRRAQFDLAQKVYQNLRDMTFAVERIDTVRLALDERAGHLPQTDPVAKSLRAASAEVNGFRKKIVATKEGGMITGEERLREFLADLYGQILSYEGRPSQTQIDRAEALGRELADVVKGFEAWAAKDLAALNASIAEKQLEPVKLLSREEWQKIAAQTPGGNSKAQPKPERIKH
ncbi:MAG: VPS10 domain-containing protein [Gemmataceae bacterium]